MSDDELRAWSECVVELSAGGIVNTEFALHLTLARRLLELLPPADDETEVTTDWLKSVGCYQGDDHTVSIGRSDLIIVVFYPPGVFGQIGRLCLWTPKDGAVSEIPSTRGHVRRLCSALGVTLTEPTHAPHHPADGTRGGGAERAG